MFFTRESNFIKKTRKRRIKDWWPSFFDFSAWLLDFKSSGKRQNRDLQRRRCGPDSRRDRLGLCGRADPLLPDAQQAPGTWDSPAPCSVVRQDHHCEGCATNSNIKGQRARSLAARWKHLSICHFLSWRHDRARPMLFRADEVHVSSMEESLSLNSRIGWHR